MGHTRVMTGGQKRVLDAELGYDSGERFSLVAVSGYEITNTGEDAFGTVFSIIDCETGDEVAVSPAVSVREVRDERVRMLARVMHLNGREDVYAA